MRRRLAPFAVIVVAQVSSATAVASPPILFYTEDLRVAARDASGRPVIPNRFDCIQVQFSDYVGQLPAAQPCVGWEVFLHPQYAPATPPYVPYDFSRDGNGVIRLPGGITTSFESIHFLIAHGKGSALPAAILLENPIPIAAGSKQYLLRFPQSRGRPPVMKKPPSCTVLARVEERGARIQLSVAFEDPEGEPLYFQWVVRQARLAQDAKMEVEASVFLGPQQFTAVACDPDANCTAAYLPVDVRPSPGFEPSRPELADQRPASGSPMAKKGKNPPRTGQVFHANYPTTIQRCKTASVEKPVRKPGT